MNFSLEFTNETWYKKQTIRWRVLDLCGWKFDIPPHIDGFAGVFMHLEKDSDRRDALFYVPIDIDPRLLEACEAYNSHSSG